MPQKRGRTVKHQRSRKQSTRKQGARSKVMTIPEVRSSLKHISDYTESILRSGKATTKQNINKFIAEWRRVFGKKISYKAAKSYIESMMKVSKGNCTRKMRGGSGGENLLYGSPIQQMMRPGGVLPYGNYPPYLNHFMKYPEPAIQQDCGTQQGILPQAGMGSNVVMKGGRRMKGGGLFSGASNLISAAMMRPFVGENPTSNQANLMTAWKGLPSPPGPESWQKTWVPHMNPHSPPPLTSVLSYNRDLTNDIIRPV